MTAVILSHQTGHVTTDHATGTGQTLRRRGPVSSLVAYSDAHHQNNYSFRAKDLSNRSPQHSMIYIGFVKTLALRTQYQN